MIGHDRLLLAVNGNAAYRDPSTECLYGRFATVLYGARRSFWGDVVDRNGVSMPSSFPVDSWDK